MSKLLERFAPHIFGVILIVMFTGGWQFAKSIKRNGELETKLIQQAAETRECTDTNAGMTTEIKKLTKEINDMVERRRADTELREKILIERDKANQRADVIAAELEKERDNEIISDEQCMEFNSLDPSRFCPATADQLRLRSRGKSGNEDRDSGEEGRGI